MNNMPDDFKPELESFTSPYFFFSNTQSAKITYVSRSVEEVLGYSSKEQIGKKYTDFLDMGNPLNSDIQRCNQERFQPGSHPNSKLRVVHDSNGCKKVLHIQTYGRADESGRVVLNHGIAHDVTERFLLESRLHERLCQLQIMIAGLSDREKNVLELVISGRLNKSIARELDVSERTVESARARLMKKFKANTTAELVRLATEFQILSEVTQTVHGAESLPYGWPVLKKPETVKPAHCFSLPH